MTGPSSRWHKVRLDNLRKSHEELRRGLRREHVARVNAERDLEASLERVEWLEMENAKLRQVMRAHSDATRGNN